MAKQKRTKNTVANNVLEHGTGALNIDGCRVQFSGEADEAESKTKNQHGDFGSGPMTNEVYGKYTKDRENYNPPGRWPANFIHDGSDEVVGLFPQTKSGGGNKMNRGVKGKSIGGIYGDFRPDPNQPPKVHAANTGSAARFFYCAKANKKDRGEGNKHPTVKPTDLMRYLCRLVTPPGGTVLDPFMGSGSTGKAALLEGFRFVGIDADEESVGIARQRVEAAAEPTVEAAQKSGK